MDSKSPGIAGQYQSQQHQQQQQHILSPHRHLITSPSSSSSVATATGSASMSSSARSAQPLQPLRLPSRPRLYKIKQDLESYHFLCTKHRETLNIPFDYYMEFTPSMMRRIFVVMFHVNRLNKLLLVHLLFYHSVWWSSNSSSSHSALNYACLDTTLVYSLVYFNFHELLVSRLLVKQLLANLLVGRLLPRAWSTWWCLRHALVAAEVLAYAVANALVVYALRNHAKHAYSSAFVVCALVLPHLLFTLMHQCNVSVRLLNHTLFANYATPAPPHTTYTTTPPNASCQQQQQQQHRQLRKENSNSSEDSSSTTTNSSNTRKDSYNELLLLNSANHQLDNDDNDEVNSSSSTSNQRPAQQAHPHQPLIYTDCSNMKIEAFLHAPKLHLANLAHISCQLDALNNNSNNNGGGNASACHTPTHSQTSTSGRPSSWQQHHHQKIVTSSVSATHSRASNVHTSARLRLSANATAAKSSATLFGRVSK